MRTRTQRQDRAIKLHSFTVLTCHLTLFSNISKFSTLYTATFPLILTAQTARPPPYTCILTCIAHANNSTFFVRAHVRDCGYSARLLTRDRIAGSKVDGLTPVARRLGACLVSRSHTLLLASKRVWLRETSVLQPRMNSQLEITCTCPIAVSFPHRREYNN